MKKILLIISTIIFFININLKSEIDIFKNLSSLKIYAEKHPEYPKTNIKNWLKPNYSSFNKKTSPSNIEILIRKIKKILGFKSDDWSAETFEKLLKKIIKQQEHLEKNYILKITPTKTTNFIILTGLEGALHSLIRNLEKLKKLNIINKSLKISTNNFLIFNGNVLGRSPYILETLTVILKLIEKNPGKIFFVKGEYEIKNNWQNFGFKREIITKLKDPALKKRLLQKEIDDFLKTQPLAIYIKDQIQNNPGLIRISYFNRNYIDLFETYFSHFLQNKPIKEVDIFYLNEKVLTNRTVNIKAIIKGEKKISTYKKTDGLTRQLPDKGASAWSAFSSPTKANQILYEFINDAFLILTIKKEQDPTLSLYKQNTLDQEGFEKISYNSYSQNLIHKNAKFKKEYKIDKEKTIPIEKTPEKKQLDTQKEIMVGTIMDLSTQTSKITEYVLKGLYLRILEENKKGGVNGKIIKLIYFDDKYNPYLAEKNIELLIELDIKILLCPIGNITLKTILPITKEENMVIMLPKETSPIFRKKEFKNIIHFLASSDKEGEILINYLMEKDTPNKIALFYQSKFYSLGALEAIKKILKEFNLIEKKDWIATSHLQNSLDVSDSVKKIKKFNPEAIILLSTPLEAKNLIQKLGMEFLFNKQILGISSCSGTIFKDFIRNKNLKYINTQLSPNAETSKLQIVEDFKNAAKLSGEPLDDFILEGYIIADVFIDILKGIKGEITKEKIIEASENIKNKSYKGLHLNFNPETRSISNSVWLNTGEEVKMIVN